MPWFLFVSIYSVLVSANDYSQLRVWWPQVVFQEVPDHISLAFTVSGCPLRCPGCHSQDTWPVESGFELSNEVFVEYLNKYRHLVSCVLFFGGDWWPQDLVAKLKIARNMGLKTCLYTGRDRVSAKLKAHLDYLKVGAWRAESGGLNMSTTNQRFYDLGTGECLNHRFQTSLPHNAIFSELKPESKPKPKPKPEPSMTHLSFS